MLPGYDDISDRARSVVQNRELRDRFLRGIMIHPKGDPVISSKIEEALGITGPDVRAIVSYLRLQGQPIGSDNTGYYWCTTAEELQGTIDHVDGRMTRLLRLKDALVKTQARLRLGIIDTPQEDLFG